ncbi:MAG: hypothetical protein WC856_24050 [Methylococcaceae bacterium]|jgi:hypothetical protein
MKTRKHNLNAIALGVALAMGSMSALAEPPPVTNPAAAGAAAIVRAELASDKPTFNSNEQVGLCLIESVVSMLAARTNDFGCDTARYDLQVATTSPTAAVAELDGGVDVGGTTLEGRLFPTRDIGTKCKVDDARGLNLLKRLELVNYNGAHGWSKTNEIFNSDALIKIRDRQTGSINKYREVDIKDFFKQVISGRSWEFDWGLEDIKKFRAATTTGPEFFYPVQKWGELSWYRHENGGEGGLWVTKYQVIPRSAVGCTIRVESYDVNNGSGEFYVGADVIVGRQSLLETAN